jgi:hypothetical protein
VISARTYSAVNALEIGVQRRKIARFAEVNSKDLNYQKKNLKYSTHMSSCVQLLALINHFLTNR